jgi:hypothetical protein
MRHHVTMEVEGIDRMDLGAQVPGRQTERVSSISCGISEGYPIDSTPLIAPLHRRFFLVRTSRTALTYLVPARPADSILNNGDA